MTDQKIKDEIAEYCRHLLKGLKIDYLLKNNVYPNEFLEYLFSNCLLQYHKYGSYEQSAESLAILFAIKKESELFLSKIKEKELTIIGIDKFDNLILEK